ncbi:MAG: oligopeptide:H+ symporter, partial [Bacteroidales bacterium]|nr:oligopeptide:H+ symporter [Bacteroidales bacterium]
MKNHPKGLIPAALSNMGERFGYYIMNAVLTLFLCSKFGLPPTQGALIFSIFYFGIYALSLVGGALADKLNNYKGTIIAGLITMAVGYTLLAIPIMSNSDNKQFVFTFTCVSLFVIALGNGLFKGNLQAIVGAMYNDKRYEKNRDAGFQIFYVFINIGGMFAPFVAPFLRDWWLKVNHFVYNADITTLCHKFLQFGQNMIGAGATQEELATGVTQYETLTHLAHNVTLTGSTIDPSNLSEFCTHYLNTFNTGIHYAFIASVAAMLISLVIFLCTKKIFPNPMKEVKDVVALTQEERLKMAKEIKQRMLALFAVLGVVIFFWFSFHQNTVALKFFARDFINTNAVPPEVWDFINPLLVVCLTPLIIWFFSFLRKKGKEPSTPKKIAIGMGIVLIGYLFLTIISSLKGYPSYNEYMALNESGRLAIKSTPW